jgi:hypothetical protein
VGTELPSVLVLQKQESLSFYKRRNRDAERDPALKTSSPGQRLDRKLPPPSKAQALGAAGQWRC